MNFDLLEEQIAVRDVASRIAEDLLSAAAPDAETAKSVPANVSRTLLETGLFPMVPEDFGGGGVLDPLLYVTVIEKLAHGDPGITAGIVGSAHAALLIERCGTSAQKAKYLTAFGKDSEMRAGVALYEGFGRAPSEYRTKFEKVQSGWRLTGRKVGVVNGASAQPLIVVGVNATGGGLCAAIVSSTDVGVKVEQSDSILGLEAAALASLSFELTVTEEQLLGGSHVGVDALSRAVSMVRLAVAAIAVGCAQRAMEYSSHYATERVAFGRPIAAFQGVSFMMADAEIKIQAARLELSETASRLDRSPVANLEKDVGSAVALATRAACAVTPDAIQVLGGHGFLRDHPVERWYRAAGGLGALDFDISFASFSTSL